MRVLNFKVTNIKKKKKSPTLNFKVNKNQVLNFKIKKRQVIDFKVNWQWQWPLCMTSFRYSPVHMDPVTGCHEVPCHLSSVAGWTCSAARMDGWTIFAKSHHKTCMEVVGCGVKVVCPPWLLILLLRTTNTENKNNQHNKKNVVEFCVKREDLISPMYGGNKVRTLQHQLAVCESRRDDVGKDQETTTYAAAFPQLVSVGTGGSNQVVVGTGVAGAN